jgi:hypothetical protein
MPEPSRRQNIAMPISRQHARSLPALLFAAVLGACATPGANGLGGAADARETLPKDPAR